MAVFGFVVSLKPMRLDSCEQAFLDFLCVVSCEVKALPGTYSFTSLVALQLETLGFRGDTSSSMTDFQFVLLESCPHVIKVSSSPYNGNLPYLLITFTAFL